MHNARSVDIFAEAKAPVAVELAVGEGRVFAREREASTAVPSLPEGAARQLLLSTSRLANRTLRTSATVMPMPPLFSTRTFRTSP
jgi:hypothetical protein